MSELLPCPFCGDGDSLYVEHLEGTILHPAFRVRCDNCGASTGYTDKGHAAEWNARATPSRLKGIATQPAKVSDALEKAIWRLEDMLMGDDGQAWKEAEKALPHLKAALLAARATPEPPK